MNRIYIALLALAAFPSLVAAQKSASYEIPLPGSPFGVVASQDQHWIFVSLSDGEGGPAIAVLRNTDGNIKIKRTVAMHHSPTGLVLTHNGDTLIAAAGDAVVFFDTQRLETGQSDAAFQWVSDGPQAGSIYANVTDDDKTLFVSDESRQAITVMDLDRIRAHGRDSAAALKNLDTPMGAQDAVVGSIAAGLAPIALTFSKDEHWLFSTSELAPADWDWPSVLAPEGRGTGQEKVPEGAVIVIDVSVARTNPPLSVVARVPAGGSPVRSSLSPDGKRLFVAARNSNAILVFDTTDLVQRPARARPTKVPVGSSPVPVIVVADGKYALVGNSDRFSNNPGRTSTLTVLDTSFIGTAQNPKIGEIPCGAFPREFHLSRDGKTLFVTNFRSHTLQVIDVTRLLEILVK